MTTKPPKHVHAYTDRHGKQRIYLRKPGEKRVPLPGPLYSHEFWKAYYAAKTAQPAAKPKRNPQGSVSAAIVAYYSSAEYKHLAESTRENYRRILERFRSDHGAKPLVDLQTKHINAIIDRMAERPAAANGLRKRLHTVMEFAIGAGLITANPISRAKHVSYVEKSYRSWTEADKRNTFRDAFEKNWIEDWALDGFTKRPPNHREKWAQLYAALQEKRISIKIAHLHEQESKALTDALYGKRRETWAPGEPPSRPPLSLIHLKLDVLAKRIGEH
jgi:hypothetical protein